MRSTASIEDIYKIIYTEHFDPYTVLGIHKVRYKDKNCVAVRAFMPLATHAYVVREFADGHVEDFPMLRVHGEGFFEYVFDQETEPFPYKLRRETPDGEVYTFYDSYSFLPQLTEFDLYLFGEGNHYRVYEKLGAHYRDVGDIGGVEFAVWAPNARSVSVIGSFNDWDRRRHAMRVLGSSGVWEIFIPGIKEGELYKYEIKTKDGHVLAKADPFGTSMELRPRTASVVHVPRAYAWNDITWMTKRRDHDTLHSPVSIYEVHAGSWRKREVEDGPDRALTYRELADELVPYVKENGYTHVEFLPITEHPFDGSWGYQVSGYYAPTSRYGSPEDFMFLVDSFHAAGIGVILDWVPAHFPKDSHALGWFDGTHLFEHDDPRKGEHMDWGTLIFNFGRKEVRNFLIANALFWLDRFHIDGLRIDAVASMLYLDYSRKEGEWLPNEFGGRENLEAIDFLRQLNWVIHSYYPGVIVMAEESTAFSGVTHEVDNDGLGFDLKWNMGWMNDTLEYFEKDPIFRKYHHNNLTFSLLYAFSERFMLPISHDEVVHGKKALISKMPGDYWQKFANMRLFFGYQFGHPGKKLLFMGQEFGQWDEWNHDTQLDWKLLEFDAHRQLLSWVRDLNYLYRRESPLFEDDLSWEGFQWIDLDDANRSILSFERIAKDKEDRLVFLCNFTPSVHHGYRLGVSQPGIYQELLNSDAECYGGSGVGNFGRVESEPVPMHTRPDSLLLSVPPLAVLVLKLVRK
ncbi:MAG: 1,4-alpha-glucan branching protein GlgB [Bacteroidetes bacterium]|nr:1,4-alpha-glucan branching protein GlgB [Bacteroidota bacterium]